MYILPLQLKNMTFVAYLLDGCHLHFRCKCTCDKSKIAEKRSCVSGSGAEHGFEKCIFDLHFHCIIMKMCENRNCASFLGGEHDFENVRKVSRAVGDNLFSAGSAAASVF